jgi:uncharacterized membrane-anchored protein YjiN (DUF445 family)
MYYRHTPVIGRYSNKYGKKTINLIEELLLHGICLQYYINKDNHSKYINDNKNMIRNKELICNDYLHKSNNTILLHEEHNIYGSVRQPSINTIIKLFKNDNKKCNIIDSLY